MGKIVFILGGARSGKSSYAIKLAKGHDKKVAFVATCLALDEEMKTRIGLHKKTRPGHWKTFEEPIDLVPLLKEITPGFDIVIIDCITLLISNLLSKNLEDNKIEERVGKLLEDLGSAKYKTLIVSNEVGLGIVPDNELGRRFRDLAGKINQMIAHKASEVFFMVSGLPLKVKEKKG